MVAGIDSHTWLGNIRVRGKRGSYNQLKPRLEGLCQFLAKGNFNMSDYLADVRRYDAKADEAVVGKIVKHLGIALRNKDSSLVACSDQAELARVREKWCIKKFGATDDAKSNAIIQTVCETMKADKSKGRVTFYYLVAKHLDKLGAL